MANVVNDVTRACCASRSNDNDEIEEGFGLFNYKNIILSNIRCLAVYADVNTICR